MIGENSLGNRTFCIVNLGCKVNRVESDTVSEMLCSKGWTETSLDVCDMILVNTCTVTSDADKKARKAVRHALSANPNADVIVTGCASQMEPSVFEAMSDHVCVIPKAELLDEVQRRAEEFEASFDSKHHLPSLGSRSRLGVKVQDGCDNSCTYCIVCKARGPARSMDPDEISDRVSSLCERGIQEIILTGIDLGAYVWEGNKLADLLDRLLVETKGYFGEDIAPRFRISSIEPTSIDVRLISAISESNGRICRHLHIPLQSGSDEILKRMDRHYTTEEYVALIDKIRANIPEISLTTDIIVGFPGESEQDFQNSMELAKRCGFSNIHVFPYSPRKGTIAAELPDQLSSDQKSSRAKDLRQLAHELRCQDAKRRLGSEEMFLVQDDGMMMSESYYAIPSPSNLCPGTLVPCIFDRI